MRRPARTIAAAVLVCAAATCLYIGYREWSVREDEKKAWDVLVSSVTVPEATDTDTMPVLDIDWDELLSVNSDVIGWIQGEYVDGECLISYPILLGETNDDYIHTDLYGEYSYSGCIFADYPTTRGDDGVTGLEPVRGDARIVLFGHNMANGSMFARIRKYKDSDWARAHNLFRIYTPYSTTDYEILSVMSLVPKDSFYTHYYTANADFDLFVDELLANSLFALDRKGGIDKVVSLSTCDGRAGTSNRCIVNLTPVSE